MTVEQFGRGLLETGDLDPVYVMLAHAQLPSSLLARWIVAYTWFYHVGVASWLCEQQDMTQAAIGLLSFAPRASERRHFRGAKALHCLNWFHDRFGKGPEFIVRDEWFWYTDFKNVTKSIQETPQYGPWMAFKLYDIGDRVLRLPLEPLTPSTLKMYSEPTKGAKLVAMDGESVGDTVHRLVDTFHERKAPPHFDRPVGVLEVETILCKYKSHLNGHYPLGKDTAEMRHNLDWRPNGVSQHLKGSCPLWA